MGTYSSNLTKDVVGFTGNYSWFCKEGSQSGESKLSLCVKIKTNLAYPIIRDPNTDPIPAPDPATPTVAAPAPMNLAAESISRLTKQYCED